MSTRDNSLDAVRAVAIAAVVLVHTAGTYGPTEGAMREVFAMGRYGVQMFFILSGFLMSSLYPAGGGWSAKAFAVKRLGRIYPLYLLFFIGWALYSGSDATPANPVLAWSAGLSLTAILYWRTAWMFLPGGWSISAEALHYTLFTRMRKWSSRRIALIGALSAALAAFVHVALVATPASRLVVDQPLAYQWAVMMAPWSTFPYFALGLLIGRAPRPLAAWVGSHRALALVLGIGAFTFTAFKGSLVPIDAVWVTLLFEAVRSSPMSHSRTIAWIGRRSYGTYFTHFVVLAAADGIEESMGWIPSHGIVLLLAASCVVLLLSSVLSQALWVTIEHRALLWARSRAAVIG